MIRCISLCVILNLVVLTGCGSSDSEVEIGKPSELAAPESLSLSEWKTISDLTLKYDSSTLEQLRASDPALKTNKAWDKFLNEVILPQMVKDKKAAEAN